MSVLRSLPTRDLLAIVRSGLGGGSAPKRVVVAGAGMAGLVAAYELRRAGHTVVLLEARARAHGADDLRALGGDRAGGGRPRRGRRLLAGARGAPRRLLAARLPGEGRLERGGDRRLRAAHHLRGDPGRLVHRLAAQRRGAA